MSINDGQVIGSISASNTDNNLIVGRVSAGGTISGNVSSYGNTVTSVNNVRPDRNGNVTLDYASTSDIPDTLPNPGVLTINGASYDGSEDIDINIDTANTFYVFITDNGDGTGAMDKSYDEMIIANQDGSPLVAMVNSADGASFHGGVLLTFKDGAFVGTATSHLDNRSTVGVSITSDTVSVIITASSGGFIAQNEPPEDTSLLWIDLNDNTSSGGGNGNTSLGVSGASVGQTVKITAVDKNGVPTAWEPVDLDAGGDEVWETIIDYTVPEDCVEVLLKTDIDGNPFQLKKAIMTFLIMPIADPANVPSIRYGFESTISGVYAAAQMAYALNNPPKNAGKCTAIRFICTKQNNGVTVLASQSGASEISIGEQFSISGFCGTQMYHQDTLRPVIQTISAAGVGSYNTAIGAGTRIVVVGVRE